MSLIELTEPDPPGASEPITWRLLTSHPVANTDAAWQIIDWYRARWTIEQLFRLLKKQGLRLEDSQVETAERLLKLVAIAAHARGGHPAVASNAEIGGRRPWKRASSAR